MKFDLDPCYLQPNRRTAVLAMLELDAFLGSRRISAVSRQPISRVAGVRCLLTGYTSTNSRLRTAAFHPL